MHDDSIKKQDVTPFTAWVALIYLDDLSAILLDETLNRGQRPYFMGYLSVYTLYALSTVGSTQTLRLLNPYLGGDDQDFIDTGVDIVMPQTLAQ